jgi:hypothetical protein
MAHPLALVTGSGFVPSDRNAILEGPGAAAAVSATPCCSSLAFGEKEPPFMVGPGCPQLLLTHIPYVSSLVRRSRECAEEGNLMQE